MTDVSVVTPLYRTSCEWPVLLDRIGESLDGTNVSWECIGVDDACPDSTGLATVPPPLAGRVEVVRLSHNVGQHGAIRIGLARATGDLIAVMDSDLQDRPEDLPRLLVALDRPFDVAVAVDRGLHQGFGRRMTGSAFRFSRWVATTGRVPIGAGMFLVARRDIIEEVAALNDPEIHLISALHRVGARFVGVSLPRDPRDSGQTSFSKPMRVRLGLEALVSATAAQPVLSGLHRRAWVDPHVETVVSGSAMDAER